VSRGEELVGVERPVRVLVVDDEPALCRMVPQMLELEGFIAEGVLDGVTALARLGEEPAPDVVLLDIMMPDMDGFTVLRHIKENPALAHIPVGLVSAKKDPLASRRAAAGGAVGLINKPFDIRDLLELIYSALGMDGSITR
jgi:CheY-like chemotaxis protein